MSTKEQPWDDETREFRGPSRGARILSFETAGEYRTRTAGSSPPLGPRPKRPTTLAEKRLQLDEMAVRARAQDRRLQELGLLPTKG
jgi:hypothetical protein